MIKQRELSTEEIARSAYELYVRRGGEHGKDVEDWIAAEKDLTTNLSWKQPKPELPKQGIRP